LIIGAGFAVTLVVIGLIGFIAVVLQTAPLGRLGVPVASLAAVPGVVPTILVALHE
jgi:hypothetical protein